MIQLTFERFSTWETEGRAGTEEVTTFSKQAMLWALDISHASVEITFAHGYCFEYLNFQMIAKAINTSPGNEFCFCRSKLIFQKLPRHQKKCLVSKGMHAHTATQKRERQERSKFLTLVCSNLERY